MHAVLAAQLRKRQLAPDCLDCYLRFRFSALTGACRLRHLYSSFPRDEPSLSSCPIRGDPLSLLNDAKAFRFNCVIAEALDRISRDQEDIAAIYKRLRHADIR